jgi:hypothetical protein
MHYYKLFSLGLIVVLLSSCGTLPERIESDDIPSWCQEEEESISLMPYLIPGVSTIIQKHCYEFVFDSRQPIHGVLL